MTAVLTAHHPAADPGPPGIVVPAARASRPVPAEPAVARPRFWDHEAAAWRPCPVVDDC